MSQDNQNIFDDLIADALQQELQGWDFSYIDRRWQMQPTSWDYPQIVRGLLARATSMLDMGTGGGEMLADLTPLPPHTYATKGVYR